VTYLGEDFAEAFQPSLGRRERACIGSGGI
jgi:hypothetical protein